MTALIRNTRRTAAERQHTNPLRRSSLASRRGDQLRKNALNEKPDLPGLPAVAVRVREHDHSSRLLSFRHVEEHEREFPPCVTNPMLRVTK